MVGRKRKVEIVGGKDNGDLNRKRIMEMVERERGR